MKTKPADTRYCNVNKLNIETHRPIFDDDRLRLFYHYFTERYLIYKRKEIDKLPAPWTDDKVLKTFKFTNIRRETDRNSRWLIDNIINNEFINYYEKIYRVLLFRLYNSIETAELLGLDEPMFFAGNWVHRCCKKISLCKPDTKFYTSAYKTVSIKTGLVKKYPYANYNEGPLFLVKDLIDEEFDLKLINAEDQYECYRTLMDRICGAGKFIAYQLFIDLTYIGEFPFSENEFTVAGPGCYFGLEMLLEDRYNFNGLSPEEMVFWLRDNLDKEFNRLELEWNLNKLMDNLPEYDRCLNVMMLENCMCEFSKYYALYSGQRKCRIKYKYE